LAAHRPAVSTIKPGERLQQWLQPAPIPADNLPMNPLHAQLPSWMFRLVARRPAAQPTSVMSARVQVCPPELWPSSVSWHGRMRRWGARLAQRCLPLLPAQARPVNRLAMVKAEFDASLVDVMGEPALHLRDRIQRARSLRELWHLRSSVYGEVAVRFSQAEAEQRLASLNRHFPVRAPRSGLMPLQS